MTRFTRSDLSKLRSTRRSIDRRISKAEWRMANDPMADLARLSSRVDDMMDDSADLTRRIDAEEAADERRALRQQLLRHITT